MSEALDRALSSQIHPRTQTRSHAHSSCQSRVQPHRLLLATPSGYLPLCTVSYSINTDSTVTLTHFVSRTHAHPHTDTLGDNALQWGLQWPKAAKHLLKKKKKGQNSAHRTGWLYNYYYLFFVFTCIRKSGWKWRDWAWLEDHFITMISAPSARAGELSAVPPLRRGSVSFAIVEKECKRCDGGSFGGRCSFSEKTLVSTLQMVRPWLIQIMPCNVPERSSWRLSSEHCTGEKMIAYVLFKCYAFPSSGFYLSF